MRDDVINIYKDSVSAHSQIYSQVCQLDKLLPQLKDCKELADCAIALAKSAEYIDTLRKEIERLQKKAERAACLVYLSHGVAAGPIKTEYVSASVDMKKCMSIPKKSQDREKWKAISEYVGMKQEFLDSDDTELVRIHWPGMMKHIDDLQAAGRPLPACLSGDNEFVEYRLIMRTNGKKGLGT